MIAHVDMDCFFVAVERLKDPSLVGRPVVVGGDPAAGRSVVASASYEAREFGIHSAMPMAVAIRRCPDLVVVPGDFGLYDDYYRKVKKTLGTFSPVVEMTSIDEGYVGLAGTERLWGCSLEVGERIRRAIKQRTGLNCTVGITRNKLMSKIASNWAKPNGLLYIPVGREREFLAPLPVEVIPGVGEKTAEALRAFGLETVGQVAAVDKSLMEATFGDHGRWLWHAAQGEANSDLVPEWERKSIGKEITFRTDTTDRQYMLAVLYYLTEKVCSRLRKEGKASRTVSIKLRYEDFETHERSVTLRQPENHDQAVFSVARRLMIKAITRRVGIRLVGISLSNLTHDEHQMNLFDEWGWLRIWHRLSAVDKVRRKFGFDTLLAGEAIYLINCGVSI